MIISTCISLITICWTSFHVLTCHRVFSVMKFLFKPFAHFFLSGSFPYIEMWGFCIYSEYLGLYWYILCKYILPICAVIFIILMFFIREGLFNFSEEFLNFFLLWTVLLMSNLRSLGRIMKIFTHVFFWKFSNFRFCI